MRELAGRVAAVTGAGSGIGRALALELAQAGARLAISDVDEAGLAETARVARVAGATAHVARVDGVDREAVHARADAVAAELGAVHLILNNAGVALRATLSEATHEELEWLFGIDFWGVVHGTKAFLPHLRRAGRRTRAVFGTPPAMPRAPRIPRPQEPVRLLVSDAEGRIFDHPRLLLAGERGAGAEAIDAAELIPLPRGSDLFTLPGRAPVGIEPGSRKRREVSRFAGGEARAVAAFLAPAHTACHHAAWRTREGAPVLPTYAYTAVGFADGRYWTSAFRSDPDPRQDPWRFARARVAAGIAARRTELPRNRVARQLERCALEYGCRAAQNFFLGRHEAPLPTSIACNAQCLGCISLQPDGAFRASHDRLATPPSAREVADVALAHLGRVPRGVVSFGQGCEGEPLLFADLLVESVRRIRERTARGTVNLNTNASRPDDVARLVDAGLDAIRASLNSPRPDVYAAYYRPRGYGWASVEESLRRVVRAGGHASINLLCFPGVTDTPAELAALAGLVERTGLHLVQLRNLNVDPELYRSALPPGAVAPGRGMRWLRGALAARFPGLRFGYFNPAVGRAAERRCAPGGGPVDAVARLS
jgi:pyruvate-formate lyase-activating enzyme